MEDSCCFYSSLPAEAVTIAIIKHAPFDSWCWLMNRKVKSFKQTLFLSEQCVVSKVITSIQSAVFWPWHRPTIVSRLVLIYCPVDNTLFEVSPEICCLSVNSLLWLCHVGDKPVQKIFIVPVENWIRCLPKIISKCCELGKLYDINPSSPVFWDTLYV